ncbi:tetratricopeptide repeat protein [Maricaulis sp.]|uniref:tetratricopeptide repeat protein n=1 Tax=Maricaulis sp. TaxID=1486257 RepID=UPI002607CC8D|nr:tetratricopeptide repeat protein [Maricaulis sp.]
MKREYIFAGAGGFAVLLVLVVWLVMRGGGSSGYTMADAEEAFASTDYVRTAEILSELAEENNLLAQYRLGMMYLDGRGVEADADRAAQYLARAYASEYAPAGEALAGIYVDRAENADSVEAGVEWYQRAADVGSMEAMTVLGSYYLSGTGVEADPERAIELLAGPAEAGDVRAQSNLGYAYLTGTGVPQSDADAFRWYLAASQTGLVRAQPILGMLYESGRGTERNVPEATRWYLNALSAGAPGVDARLGALIANGEVPVQDEFDAVAWVGAAARGGHAPAAAWLEGQAEAGNADALAMLGEFYIAGQVLPQNASRGLDYQTRAAEAGSAGAQLAMAQRYATGDGVEQDYVQAHIWSNLAAAAGEAGAAEQRDAVARLLSPEQLEQAQQMATEWLEQAGND